MAISIDQRVPRQSMGRRRNRRARYVSPVVDTGERTHKRVLTWFVSGAIIENEGRLAVFAEYRDLARNPCVCREKYRVYRIWVDHRFVLE